MWDTWDNPINIDQNVSHVVVPCFSRWDKSFPGILFTVEPSTGRNVVMSVEGMAALAASLYGDVDLHPVALRVFRSPFG
jgi:hypothetical protein